MKKKRPSGAAKDTTKKKELEAGNEEAPVSEEVVKATLAVPNGHPQRQVARVKNGLKAVPKRLNVKTAVKKRVLQSQPAKSLKKKDLLAKSKAQKKAAQPPAAEGSPSSAAKAPAEADEEMPKAASSEAAAKAPAKATSKSRPSLGSEKAEPKRPAASPKAAPPGAENPPKLKRTSGASRLEEEAAPKRSRKSGRPSLPGCEGGGEGGDASRVSDTSIEAQVPLGAGAGGPSSAALEALSSAAGMEGAEAPAEAAPERPKAKAAPKAAAAGTAAKAAKANARHFGASPTVMLAQGLPEPPRGLLPEDALVTTVKPQQALQLDGQTHPETLKEAEEAGLVAPALWPGLGQVPEILRGGFRSLLILGPSGSGKSTLLKALVKELFPSYEGPLYPGGDWCAGRAVIEAFDTAFQGRDLLGSMGLSSVPSWCKPYEVLSRGEKYRANTALDLKQRSQMHGIPLVFDEWTSELDRSLARVVNVALGKWLRKEAQSALAEEKKAAEERVKGTELKEEDEECEEADGWEGGEAAGAKVQLPEGVGGTDGEEEDFPRGAPDSLESMAEAAEEDADEHMSCSFVEDAAEEGEEMEGEGEEEEETSEGHEEEWAGEEYEEHDAEEHGPGDGCGEDGEELSAGGEAAAGGGPRPGLSRMSSADGPADEGESAPVEGDSSGVAEDTEKVKRPGPFIFAGCHEDVAAYLQPEFVCVCAVGEAPRAFRNEGACSALRLHADLQGELEPLPVHPGFHMLVGHWWSHSKDVQNFNIGYKDVKASGQLRIQFEGGRKVETLRRTDDPHPKATVTGWYSGTIHPDGVELRLRVSSERTMLMQQWDTAKAEWSKDFRASRRFLPAPSQALMLTRDPESVARNSATVNYGDYDAKVLKAHNWYLPPELASDEKYAGLERAQEPHFVSISDFKYDTNMEKVDDNQTFLATYVGEPQGGLSAKLQGVSRLLDAPFDGLCIHKIPQLPTLNDFCIGVITGPSGSGKSTLARHLFGPSPSVLWTEEAAVLAHFDSLASAREFCGAVGLDLNLAMRPYGALSSGEQSRAVLARILQRAATSQEGKPWVIDEFTSLVDRPLARRMARGVQRLAQCRSLRKLVFVSCHDDFVGSGALEPDWLFECRNGRLLRFRTPWDMEMESARAPFQPRLIFAKARLEEAEKELGLLHQRLSDCSASASFTETFRTELEVMSKALSSFCEKELERQRSGIDTVNSQIREAEEQVAKRMREAVQDTFCAASKSPDAQGRNASEADAALGAWLARELEPPVLKLEVRRALPREWVHFRDYHYKDHSLHTACMAYVGLVDGQAACFLAMISEKVNFVQKNALRADWAKTCYPRTWAKGKPRRLYREHRTVVLPDFQGMGLAPLLCDTVALHVLDLGHDFTSQTVHPFYGGYRDRSPFWQALPSNRKEYSQLNGNYKFSHVFVGAVRPDGKTDPKLQEELNQRIKRRVPRSMCRSTGSISEA